MRAPNFIYKFSAGAIIFGYSSISCLAQTYPDANEVGDCSVSQFANCDSTPDQDQLELDGDSGAQDGNWADLSGGVARRPFVKRLSLINNGLETVLLSNGTTSSTLSNTPGSVGVIISPLNLCDSTEDPSVPSDNCYETPNRIQVTLVYRKSDGQVGTNFSFPNDGDQGTLTGEAVELKSFDGSQSVTLNADTTIDLTIGLNSLGESLRWTWVNGIPSFWDLANLGRSTATVRLKVRPAVQPALHYPTLPSEASLCTAIPVLECTLDRSSSDWLGAAMILSLDETLSSSMTGALFGTEGAIIGSIDASVNGTTGLPEVTYGLASSHFDHTGTLRSATLRAFIPEAALVHNLGMPPVTNASAGTNTPSTTISVRRTDASSSSTTSFQVWEAADRGENGLLATISGITFSAPQYELKSKSGAPKVPTARLRNNRYSFTLSGTTTGVLGSCGSKVCTVTAYSAPGSVFKSSLTKLSTVKGTVRRGRLSAGFVINKTARIKQGTRLLLVVTNSQNKVLSSTPLVLP